MIAPSVFAERADQILVAGVGSDSMACDKGSLSGAVSQRACVFCGARVVLYPIADALHLVHGPIGCAAYTWDIRGALSSGPELHRLSFSTDMREKDVVFGAEKKLELSLRELIEKYQPKAAFVYSTCVAGIIGDDIEAVCRRVEKDMGIPTIPVQSEGFKGSKRAGYSAACKAIGRLVGTGPTEGISKLSLNILGDFNLAGEIWLIRSYYEKMGIEVVANITGDGRVGDIQRAHGAALNVVQCSGATMELARYMKESTASRTSRSRTSGSRTWPRASIRWPATSRTWTGRSWRRPASWFRRNFPDSSPRSANYARNCPARPRPSTWAAPSRPSR
jgi:nitrogenase molybdenum-cofactor synthesis protein NifE